MGLVLHIYLFILFKERRISTTVIFKRLHWKRNVQRTERKGISFKVLYLMKSEIKARWKNQEINRRT